MNARSCLASDRGAPTSTIGIGVPAYHRLAQLAAGGVFWAWTTSTSWSAMVVVGLPTGRRVSYFGRMLRFGLFGPVGSARSPSLASLPGPTTSHVYRMWAC